MKGPSSLLVPCFILHRRAFRESSFILDIVAKDLGMLSVVLRGGKGKSSLSGALSQLFRPLLMTLTGNGEMKTAYSIEANGPTVNLSDKYLYSGFYVNELVCRLSPKNVDNDQLYTLYQQTLARLRAIQQTESIANIELEKALRYFELTLLEQLGFAIDCHYSSNDQQAIEPLKHYRYDPEQGFINLFEHDVARQTGAFSGADIIAIGEMDFSLNATLKAAKQLTRLAMLPHLGHKPLKSRELFLQHQQ